MSLILVVSLIKQQNQNYILLIKFFIIKNGARSMGPMQRLLLTVTKLNNKLSTEGKC